MTLVVATDLDGVSYPFPLAVSSWAAARGDLPPFPAEPQERAFWRGLGVNDEEFAALLDLFAAEGGYRMAAPYPEAVAGLNALFDAGADLLAVTSRPATRDVESSTYGWIADWLLPFRAVLHGPSSKLECECDVIVDDNPADLALVLELGEAAPVLLDRPWNQDSEGLFRCSWSALPSLIGALEVAVEGVSPTERAMVVAEQLEVFS